MECVSASVAVELISFMLPTAYDACVIFSHSIQDILEHRFAHIRSGMGTHKAPTSTQAFRQGQHGDTCRISHGDKRRNSSRSAGPFEIQTTAGIRAALPVNASERAEVVRAATWADDDHVFETRSSCCVTNCEMCGV